MTAKALSDIENTRILAKSFLYAALYGRCTAYDDDTVKHIQNMQRWNSDKILEALKGFIRSSGRVPTYDEWTHAKLYGLPSKDTVKRYWDSKRALLLAARM